MTHRSQSKNIDQLRDRQFFNILTWKCASRHSGVQFFDIVTSKNGPKLTPPVCRSWFADPSNCTKILGSPKVPGTICHQSLLINAVSSQLQAKLSPGKVRRMHSPSGGIWGILPRITLTRAGCPLCYAVLVGPIGLCTHE